MFLNRENKRSMSEYAELHWDGNQAKLPLITGTASERAIDISKLRDETGLINLDSGYGNTGSCTSTITFIDGEKGILPKPQVVRALDFDFSAPCRSRAELLNLHGADGCVQQGQSVCEHRVGVCARFGDPFMAVQTRR